MASRSQRKCHIAHPSWLATIVFGFTVLPGSASDHLAFSNHGVTLIAVALLNVVAWRLPSRSRLLSRAVHIVNVLLLLFCIAFALVKPEPPAYVSAILMLALMAAAIGSDLTLRRVTSPAS